MTTWQLQADLGIKYRDTETVVPLLAMDVPNLKIFFRMNILLQMFAMVKNCVPSEFKVYVVLPHVFGDF